MCVKNFDLDFDMCPKREDLHKSPQRDTDFIILIHLKCSENVRKLISQVKFYLFCELSVINAYLIQLNEKFRTITSRGIDIWLLIVYKDRIIAWL